MTNFFQYLIDALSLGSIYALTALGIGLLFGILRLINFAHGDLITVAAYALIVPSASFTSCLVKGSSRAVVHILNILWNIAIPTGFIASLTNEKVNSQCPR